MNNVVQLGELIAPAATERAGTKNRPILSMTMHHGLVDQNEKFKKRVASADISDYKIVKRGQLVVGFPIDEGVVSVQVVYPEAIVSPAYNIWDITAGIDSKYLEKFLRSPIAISYYRSKLRSTTARRRTLTRQDFLRLPVPTPNIEEQQRLVDMLDRADALRAKRREAIARLDELAQSIFLDMFGDPVTNPKCWDKASFGSLLRRIESGSSPKCLDRPVRSGEWGVLKLGAVTSCRFEPEENKALPVAADPNPAYEVRPGDLLFARKNTPELVAACVLVENTPPKLLMPDLIFRFDLIEQAPVTKRYLHKLLTFPSKRRKVQGLAGGSASSMSNISKTRLASLAIELPPLGLQQEFDERMSEIEKAKRRDRCDGEYLDELFASLQQRAFRGDL